jgi:hypothetical protein
VYTCEQVLSYLRQFVVVEKAVVEEKKAVDAPAPGMKLLNKKTLDDEANALWGSVQAKKGKGARKAAEKQKAAEAVKVRGTPGVGWGDDAGVERCQCGVITDTAATLGLLRYVLGSLPHEFLSASYLGLGMHKFYGSALQLQVVQRIVCL